MLSCYLGNCLFFLYSAHRQGVFFITASECVWCCSSGPSASWIKISIIQAAIYEERKSNITDSFCQVNETENLYLPVWDEDTFLNKGKILLFLRFSGITWWEWTCKKHSREFWWKKKYIKTPIAPILEVETCVFQFYEVIWMTKQNIFQYFNIYFV